MICQPIRPKSKLLFIFFGVIPTIYFVVMGAFFGIFYSDKIDPITQNNCGVECLVLGGCWLFFTGYAYWKGYNLCERCTHGFRAGNHLVTANAITVEDQTYRARGYIVIRDKGETADAHYQKAIDAVADADKAEKGLVQLRPGDLVWEQDDKVWFGGCFILGLAVFGLVFLLTVLSFSGLISLPVFFGYLFAGVAISYCCVGPYFVQREEKMTVR